MPPRRSVPGGWATSAKAERPMALMRDSKALGGRPILKIVTLEIPVRDLDRAVAWYQRALGLEVAATNGRSVMLRMPPGESGESGPINLFLVETNDARRLGFCSTGTGIVHNVI